MKAFLRINVVIASECNERGDLPVAASTGEIAAL
jgi:hypothetical protein